MNIQEQFDLLRYGKDSEIEVVHTPDLSDDQSVYVQLSMHFPDYPLDEFAVSDAIMVWRRGGMILRCRNPGVFGGAWQRVDCEGVLLSADVDIISLSGLN